MRADFVQDDAVDKARQVLVAVGPHIEDGAAVEVNRVFLASVLRVPALGGAAGLVAAQKIERRFKFKFLLDERVGEILHDRLQPLAAGVLAQPVRQAVDDDFSDLLDIIRRRRDCESHED